MNKLHRLLVTVLESPSVDRDQGHIVTGDLCFIENKHLRNFISKGPNFPEGRTINWNTSKNGITKGIEDCSQII